MNNRELDFIDLLSIMSFVIGLMNLDENLTQGDKQELMQELDNKTNRLLTELRKELNYQNEILERLLHDKDKEVSGRNA